MTTIMVSIDSWLRCFIDTYNLHNYDSMLSTQYLHDNYGIVRWYKMDLDRYYEITFNDEKKMAYFILKWI